MQNLTPENPFTQQLSYFIKYNYMLIVISTLQLLLLISLIPSQLLCRQGLPIALYNIIAQLFTISMPICTIIAVKYFKYFNTVLGYGLLVLIVKIVQIFALLVFGHVGTCELSAIYRIPIAVYQLLELGCLGFDAWILKRVRRVDRQNKAIAVMKTKTFLSD